MPWEAWLTLALVAAVLFALATDRASPPTAFLGALAVLLLTGVISAQEALAGFANPAPVTVAVLYVLAGAVERTGALGMVTSALFGRGAKTSERKDLARMLLPTAAASSFLNNTPIVQMLSGEIVDWARRTGRSASRYLLPMNYAAVLGGMVTLIGTSTNVLVSGLMEANGMAPMGFFEITRIGLPIALAGVVILVLLSPFLVPDRRSPRELAAETKEYTLEMIVPEASRLAGQSVADAGLRDLMGVYLVCIERVDRDIAPVSPEEILEEGDRITFAGNVTQILDLQKMKGLTSAEERHFLVEEKRGTGVKLYEAVINKDSSLLGQTLKEADFRSKYGGAVIAIHRAGERIRQKLGDVRLHTADVLLVLADASFRTRTGPGRDFLVISSLDHAVPVARRSKAPIVGIIAAGIVFVAGAGIVPILHAAIVGAGLLVLTGVMTPRQARDAVDLNVVLTIAAGFGMGTAIAASGLADAISDAALASVGTFGGPALLIATLIATIALTELLSNNAAAALMFPIAITAATAAGLDPRPFAIIVAIGASAGFLTPIGYQTNMVVWGLGGYKFTDFARVGVALTVMTVILGSLIAWQY